MAVEDAGIEPGDENDGALLVGGTLVVGELCLRGKGNGSHHKGRH